MHYNCIHITISNVYITINLHDKIGFIRNEILAKSLVIEYVIPVILAFSDDVATNTLSVMKTTLMVETELHVKSPRIEKVSS